MRAPPVWQRAASIKGSILGTLEGQAEAEQTDRPRAAPCLGHAYSCDGWVWWGPALCQGAPCPPGARSLAGGADRHTDEQQHKTTETQGPLDQREQGGAGVRSRQRQETATISWAAAQAHEGSSGLSRGLRGGVCSGFSGEPPEEFWEEGKKRAIMYTDSLRALHSGPLFPLGGHVPGEVTVVTRISEHIAGAAGWLRLFSSPPCREGLCTKSEAGLFGDTAPRCERETGEWRGGPCQHLSVHPSMSQKGAWAPGTLKAPANKMACPGPT